MTESEQLEQSARKQLVLQRVDKIVAYLDNIDRRIVNELYWNERAHKLSMIVFVLHMGITISALFTGLSYETNDAHIDMSFLVFIVATARSIYFSVSAARLIGEYRGVINVLKIIGMIDEGEVDGQKRRFKLSQLNPFKRFTEFVERIKQTKKEHYA